MNYISGLISVIIPVYNCEKHLVKCVDSVIKQTYREIEIILVDDGSTDNSGKVCNELASLDSRIRAVHKPNGGAADARNFGLDMANGSFISFVDSDDTINHHMLEILAGAMNAYNCDVVICDFTEVCDDSEFVLSARPEIGSIIEKDGFDVAKSETVVIWNKLYRRRLWEKNRFLKGILWEDQLITLQVLTSAEKVISMGCKLYYYLIRKDGVSKRADPAALIELQRTMDVCLEYVVSAHPYFVQEYYETYLANVLTNVYNLKANYFRSKDMAYDDGYRLCRKSILAKGFRPVTRSQKFQMFLLKNFQPGFYILKKIFLAVRGNNL